ncbi:MAG: sulfatase, partial [Planctomycetota bacterium]
MNSKSDGSGGAANKSIRILFSILGLLFIAAFAATSCFRFSDDKPNIILISIDTLRHDHVGYSGHQPEGKSPSPFIDSLAEKGAVFTHAVSSSSWTLPGHYSMITGLPDELHEMYDDRMPHDPKIQTMAENLKEQGYATAGFFSGPYLHSFFGFDQGFDMYESCMKQDTMYDVMAYKGDQLNQKERESLLAEKEFKSHLDITSKAVVDKALFFARSHRKDKLFLFLHFFDVHNDYIPPAPFNQQYDAEYTGWVNGYGIARDPRINKKMKSRDLDHIKALYDGEIAWVDHNISAFFDALNKLNPEILENSIVIITSDHGEEFFEHGYIGHRWNLHGESTRIPLVFWSPRRVTEGMRIEEP